MFIRLTIKPAPGPCAYVDAWSSESTKQNERGARFMHTDCFRSLRNCSASDRCDDDPYVTFKTNISFSVWHALMKKSEFDDPSQYHVLDHNCAQASAFALEQAGIKLFQQGPYYCLFNRLEKNGIFCIPLLTLSPWDIYFRAKHYKIQMLQNSTIGNQYRFTKFKIKLWSLFTSLTEERKQVTKIVEEIEKRRQRHPEHIEAQIDILMQTFYLVTRLPTQEVCDDYIKKSKQFKQRAVNFESIIPWLILLNSGLLAESFRQCSQDLISANLRRLPFTGALLIVSGYSFFKLRNKIMEPMFGSRFSIEDTELSKSMVKLANLRRVPQ